MEGRLGVSKKLFDYKLPIIKQTYGYCYAATIKKKKKTILVRSSTKAKLQLNNSYSDFSMPEQLNNSISFIKKKPFHSKKKYIKKSLEFPKAFTRPESISILPKLIKGKDLEPSKGKDLELSKINGLDLDDFDLCAWETLRKLV